MASITYFTPTAQEELQKADQWVAFRKVQRGQKATKVPYNARTGKTASTTDSTTWSSYKDVQQEAHRYDGVGVVLQGYTGIDLDNVIDSTTGQMEQWARDIIRSVNSYTELSPSGTGVHIWVRGECSLPRGNKHGQVEMYSGAGRYFTFTGQHFPGTPRSIYQRDAEIADIQGRYFPAIQEKKPARPTPLPAPTLPSTPATLDDDAVLRHANRDKNADIFARLWAGDVVYYHPGGRPDQNKADLRLCSILAYYTKDASQIDRLVRQSGLYRAKWDRDDYSARTIALAIRNTPQTFIPPVRTARQQEQTVRHIAPWQRKTESQAERHTLLAKHAQGLQRAVQQHLEDKDGSVLVAMVPPGAGKSTSIAELVQATTTYPAGRYDVAWFAERHNMRDSIPALKSLRHIQGAGPHNCSDYKLHKALAEKGRGTYQVHDYHYNGSCGYKAALMSKGAAFYAKQFIPTTYPGEHKDGAIIDELDVMQWHQTQRFSVLDIQKATRPHPVGSIPDAFMRALQGLAAEDDTMSGRALFDALDTRLGGQLKAILGQLERGGHATIRPRAEIDILTPDALEQAERLPHNVLGPVLHILLAELTLWERGQEWNGRMQAGKGTITLRSLQGFAKWPTSLTVLDATADEDIIGRIFPGKAIKVHRVDADPPPSMQHIAIRDRRYTKGYMSAKDGREQAQAIKVARYQLAQLDPTGEKVKAGKVGLVTYQDNEAAIAQALGIPEDKTLHFWGARGSNALEDCEILLVIGTPVPNLEAVMQLARTLHWDGAPITSMEDERFTKLVDYLVRAELTQCAHRNRPMRYAGRTVITLGHGQVDYLPITEEITQLPWLTEEGDRRDEAQARKVNDALQRAYDELVAEGQRVSVRSIAAKAKVRTSMISAWLSARQAPAAPPLLCVSNTVSQTANKDTICNLGNTQEGGAAVPDDTPRRPMTERVYELLAQGYSQEDAIVTARIEYGVAPSSGRLAAGWP